jgi:membrane protein required for colicin V production
MNIAVLDLILLGVLLLSMLIGAWRGLVYEVLSLAGWVAAFIAAQIFASTVGNWLPITGMSEPVRYAAGFVATFIAAIFAAGLVAWLAKKLIAQVGLRPADRALGALFGLVRGCVILLAAATVIHMTPLKDGVWWTQSIGAGVLNAALSGLKPVLPASIAQYITG